MELHAASFDAAARASAAIAFGARNLRRSYGRAAATAAIENGMLPDELSEVLGGRGVVEAFPVAGRENVAEYVDRVVAEMMVAYLSQPPI